MLTFDAARVEQLLHHAEAAQTHAPIFEDLCNKDLWKPDADRSRGYVDSADDLVTEKIPAGLHLAKDDGLYLCSSGRPCLPDPDRPKSQLCAYASGPFDATSKTYDWDAVRKAVGGDDFVMRLELDFIREALSRVKDGKVRFIARSASFEGEFPGWGLQSLSLA